MDRALTHVKIDMMNQKTIKSYLLGDNKPGAVLALHPNARRVICGEFSVDPALVGATVTTDPLGTSTTLAEKRALMVRYAIKPDLCELAEFINVNILPWLTLDMNVEFK